MARALSDDDLKAMTDAEMHHATAYWGGKLSEMRRKNEYFFLGLPQDELAPPEIEGRSKVVDTTVRNTVLGMMAPLVKTFCGTDNVVQFEPTSESDEDAASLATDYINYILHKKNNGYQVVSTWIQDALVQKVGILKVWWDNSEVKTKEEYKGQTDADLAILLDDEEVTPIAHSSYPDEDAEEQKAQMLQQMQLQLNQMALSAKVNPQAAQALQQAQAQYQQFEQTPVPQLHDVTVERKKTEGRLRVENVPPEEFLISKESKRISDGFSAHRVLRSISDLKSMGYANVDDIASDESAMELNAERIERMSYDDEAPYLQDWQTSMDPSQRKVWLTECYMMCDVEGSGIASWRKIVRAGNQLLENVECDGHPFVSITPIPLPHRFFGLCPADLALEPQKVQTALLRAQLDNVYLQVNGRYFAVENQVNLDDLLNSRPGSIVRVKSPDAVGRLEQPQGDTSNAMELMNWFQGFTEEATGWTRQSQGGNGLQLQQTATETNIVTNRADSRVELISRTFAETGFTDLFKLMLKLVCQNQNKETEVKLGNKWVTIDPREWTNQFELTINVGLGTGNKDQQVQHLMALQQVQAHALQLGVATPKNIYNSSSKLANALGYKDADLFFIDPTAPPNPGDPPAPPPPPNPDLIKAQSAQQLAQQNNQHEMALEQAKVAVDEQKIKLEMQYKQQADQLKAQTDYEIAKATQQLQAQQVAQQNELEAQREMQRQAIESQQAEQERQVKVMLENARLEFDWKVKQLQAATAIEVAQISSKTTLTTQQMAAENAAAQQVEQDTATDDKLAQVMAIHTESMNKIGDALAALGRPKKVVRGDDGKIIGTE
jgi:hypothetical protein